MSLNSQTLESKAAELRAMAERMESLAAKRKEIEREELEISQWLENRQAARESIVSGVKRHLGSSRDPETGVPTPKTQRGWINALLTKYGKMTRDEIFEKLQPTGKAPNTLDQLSSILSRGKAEGLLGVTEDFRWYLSNSPMARKEGDSLDL